MATSAQPRKNNNELDGGSTGNISVIPDSHASAANKQLDRLEADVELLGNKYQASWARVSKFLEKLEQQQSIILFNIQARAAPDFDSLISAHLQPLINCVESLVEQTRMHADEPNLFADDGYLPPPGKEGFAQRLRVQPVVPASPRLEGLETQPIQNNSHHHVESSRTCSDMLWKLHLNEITKAVREEIKYAFGDMRFSDQELLGRRVAAKADSSRATSSLAPEHVDIEITDLGQEAAVEVQEFPTDIEERVSVASISEAKITTVPTCAFVKADASLSEGHYQTLDAFPDHADTQAFRAIAAGEANKVRKLLQKGLNPNSQLQMTVFGSKKYTHLSLLSAAVLMRDQQAVKLLAEKNASLDSPYGFVAGSCKMHWYGSAMFACPPMGQLDMLELLVQLRADLHEKASNNANMIWQCAYFGKTKILSYVLSHGVDYNSPAASQNEEGVSYSPLICAILQGRVACVHKLIEAGADVNYQNEEGSSCLEAAIRQCMPQVVQDLISHGANLQGATVRRTKSSYDAAISVSARSCLDLLFKLGNPVVVAAAACGLENQEYQVKALPVTALFEFLSLSSQSRCAMMRSLFRERTVHFRGPHHEMVVRNTAFIEKSELMPGGSRYLHPNVALVALSFDEVELMFRSRTPPTENMMQFFEELAPQSFHKRFPWSSERCVASIKTFECLVPGIYRDLRFLKEISDSHDMDAVFTLMHTQAVVEACWRDVSHMAGIEVLIHFCVLCLFFFVAESLPRGDHATVRLCAYIGIPIWIAVFLRELVDIVSHIAHGWYMEYMRYIGNWVDISRVVADGILWGVFLRDGADIAHSFGYRVLFGGCCFMKWIKLLYCLTPFHFFGLKTMPILHAMRDIGPFCIILLIYIAGIAHAFLAMGYAKADVRENFISAFLFGTINDFQLSQEVITPSMENGNYKFLIQCLAIIVTFIVPITLMNILIAALSSSYDAGVANMAMLYQSRKAEASFGLMALQHTIYGLRDTFDVKHKANSLWYSCEIVSEV